MLVVVTEGPLDEKLARAHVAKSRNGAVVVFLGVVRDRHEGREVKSVEYHAFRPMAEREIEAIARASGQTHGVEDVAVMHRVGSLPVGEASLVVAVGAPHREQAFRCAQEIVDNLKARVPIWEEGDRPWRPGLAGRRASAGASIEPWKSA